MGGGTNLQEIRRLESLIQENKKLIQENRSLIEEMKQLRSDLNTYGFVKLSDSTTVTNSTGLALPSTEKNPAVQDSLANQISKQKESIDKLPFGENWIPYGKPKNLNDILKMTGNNGICGIDIPSTFVPDEMSNTFCICHVHTFGSVRIMELVGTDTVKAKIAIGCEINGTWHGWQMIT